MVQLLRGPHSQKTPGRRAHARPTPVGKSEALEQMGSILREIMSLVVRRQWAQAKAGVKFQVIPQSAHQDIIPVSLLGVFATEITTNGTQSCARRAIH
jgi:hypothetical protein